MAVDSLKVIFLTADIDYAVQSGGLTAPERSALAKRFRVSEELLLRYERARGAYDSLFNTQWRQARVEALRRMEERGEWHGEYDKDRYSEEFDAALDRIRAAEPENEITRELDEAVAALRATVDAPTSPPTADSDR